MAYRDAGRKIFNNKDESYRQLLRERGLNHFRQFQSAELIYPTAAQIAQLKVLKRVWSRGDKYYKMAHEYYGDSNLWWVLAWFNKKPTEGHLQYGDLIYIPLPLEKVLSIYRS